jgi:hypothetical protein
MCRNIKKLRRVEGPPTDEELHDAALQFVRKVTGYRVPSRANQAAFDQAVADISTRTRELFDQLVTHTNDKVTG